MKWVAVVVVEFLIGAAGAGLFAPAVREHGPASQANERPCFKLDIEGNVIGACVPSERPRVRLDLNGNVITR